MIRHERESKLHQENLAIQRQIKEEQNNKEFQSIYGAGRTTTTVISANSYEYSEKKIKRDEYDAIESSSEFNHNHDHDQTTQSYQQEEIESSFALTKQKIPSPVIISEECRAIQNQMQECVTNFILLSKLIARTDHNSEYLHSRYITYTYAHTYVHTYTHTYPYTDICLYLHHRSS